MYRNSQVEKNRRPAERKRLSAYSLMPDDVLKNSIADLERRIDSADHCQEPMASALRHGLVDALDRARAEWQRRERV